MGRRRGTSAFPVARIKKMMQSDDEVGKIATVTPVLVAKALELMMEYVLKEAAGEATNRDTKTVTPQHLKTCVMANDSFDFLRDVVKGVQLVDEKRRRPKRPRSPAFEGRRVRRTPVKDDKIGDVGLADVDTDLVEEKVDVVGKVEEEDDYDEDDDNDNEEDSAKRDDENEQVKENEEVVPTSVDSQSATGRMSVSALLS